MLAARRALGGLRPGAPGSRAGAGAPRCCATPSRSPRPASIRRRSPTSTRASSSRTSSRRCSRYDYLARPFKLRAADSPTRMPEVVERLPQLHRPRATAASSSPTIRRSRASRASWSPRTTSTRSSATTTRAARARQLHVLENDGIVGLAELRRAAIEARQAVRLRQRRSRACSALDRYTLRRSGWPSRAPRFVYTLAVARPSPARSRARWSSATATTIDGAPGRHRAVPAGGVAAQLAHRAGAQPELPRGAATTPSRRPTTPRARRSLRAAAAGALPMIDRVEIVDHRGEPAALAVFLNARARTCSTGAARVRHRSPRRTAGSRRTSRSRGMRACSGCCAPTSPSPTSTWRIRSSAATRRRRSRCAAPSRWPTTTSARSALVRRGQAHAGAVARARRRPPATTPTSRSEIERLRPGAGQGAARPVRLRRPRRRRLARDARRPAAACCEFATQPDQTTRAVQRAVDSAACGAVGVRMDFDVANGRRS